MRHQRRQVNGVFDPLLDKLHRVGQLAASGKADRAEQLARLVLEAERLNYSLPPSAGGLAEGILRTRS